MIRPYIVVLSDPEGPPVISTAVILVLESEREDDALAEARIAAKEVSGGCLGGGAYVVSTIRELPQEAIDRIAQYATSAPIIPPDSDVEEDRRSAAGRINDRGIDITGP